MNRAEQIHGEIDLINNEDGDMNEKLIRYDLLFMLRLPDKSGTDAVKMAFTVDFEMQKEKPSEYSLVTRGMYYIASMLRDTIKSREKYQDIHKVYSIWICDCKPIHDSDEPAIRERYVHKYRPMRVYSQADGYETDEYIYDKNADIMELVFIELKKIKEHINDELAMFLDTVFNDISKLSRVIEKYTEIPIEATKIERERAEMLSKEDYRRMGKQEGRLEGVLVGRLEERKETIFTLKDMGMPLAQISKAVRLTEKEVEDILKDKKPSNDSLPT